MKKTHLLTEDDKIMNNMEPVEYVIHDQCKASEMLQPMNHQIYDACETPIIQEARSQTPLSNQFVAEGQVADSPKTPKRKRKVKTLVSKESLNAYTSPKRSFVNGDSSSNEVMGHSPSPQSSGNYIAYVSAYSSDSNLSPPRNNNQAKDSDVQNDTNTGPVNQANELKNKFKEENDTLKWRLSELNKDFDRAKSSLSMNREFLRTMLIGNTKRDRTDAKKTIIENNIRIGTFRAIRDAFGHFTDTWFDGTAIDDLNQRKARLEAMKEEIIHESANLKKKRGSKESKKNNDVVTSSKDDKDVFVKPELPNNTFQENYDRRDEIIRMRKEYIKKEDNDIIAEREKLERERHLHIKELKRVSYEEASRFRDYSLLNSKYLPISLIGKGGFSEVWRAFDLEECRHTACKIHHVHKDWKEGKKANYVRHAMREKDIHKNLDHPNIVKMYEIFTIDTDSFCTVLEFCAGNDLDFYLKQHRSMPEKETRLVIGQVVDALRYLNELKVPIIHYDLKPANILLQSGFHRFEIKITDFGLSKTIENSEGNDDIELTSQGAGTYWYLPPETFKEGPGGLPRISSKVDVWSVGVICYQCIYGKRPFGHEQSQQRILNEGTILKATTVHFPPKPAVSQLTQDFIRKCLQYEPANRADVLELARHEYVKPFNRRLMQQSPTASSRREELEH